ncbi:pumilio-family RNA binding domain-containing protein [Lachancea thermotolerans CBS 6340]|uniref:KLTH0C09394p n=1 Tax=Lachancea thermotolerans (strain ATCC 56472 / CBS 6340 / NRRL Y-8284) TaxID=559295 RepID=C5DEI0_LACTC|nr:pumilio-family RNA binding domain-containing protein [Lachancea thermotolerans CBS 6340]CAR22191.1 KLTH0C09394p [Lachancea thermotolerans CBS 6340]
MAPVISKKSGKKHSLNAKDQKTAKKAKLSSKVPEDEGVSGSSSEEEDDLDEVLSSGESDKDELDESSSEGEQEDGSEGSEDESEGSSEAKGEDDSKGGVSQHAEQRKLLKERKLQRKSGTQVQQIKSLWERLRVKNPPMPKEVREKLSNEIWELSKDCISDLVMKHDASRVVQTLVKYSSKARRDQIVAALKGQYYVLATSSYGKYLLVKLLHYGSKQSRQLIIDELHGSLRKLMRHREGAYVVEDLYVLYASHEQKQQMLREFWGSEYAVFRDAHKNQTLEQVCESSAEKKTIIARNLIGTISASVEKGSTGFQILHAAMRDYVKIAGEKETSEFIELLDEKYAELVHTPEGADVACTLLAKATAKERKMIIKNLKDHADKLIRNEHGNLVFITALMCVDDTVLMFKSFGPSVKEMLQSFVVDKYGRRPFLYILLGLDGKYFSPIVKKDLNRYIEYSKATSKKPFEQRRKELLNKFAPMYLSTISKYYDMILSDNLGSQFVSEVLVNDEFYDQLSDKEKEKHREIVNTVSTYFKGDVSEESHPIHKPFSVRLLKSLIQGGKWNAKEKKVEPLHSVLGLGTEFAQQFYEDIIDETNLLDWINNADSSFTIVAIYESLSKTENKKFFKDLKKVSKKINKDDESNKGARLLLKLMNNKA